MEHDNLFLNTFLPFFFSFFDVSISQHGGRGGGGGHCSDFFLHTHAYLMDRKSLNLKQTSSRMRYYKILWDLLKLSLLLTLPLLSEASAAAHTCAQCFSSFGDCIS